MKTLLKLGLPFIIMIVANACTGILDKEPLGRLDATVAIQNQADAIQAVNACYESLMFNNNNNNFYWAFGIITSDIAVVGGDGSRPGLTELDFLTHTPRTEEFNQFWRLNYNGITQCNTVLERVPSIAMDPILKDRIIGEALFLRAYYYFLLAQVFGDVPLIIEILAPDQLKIPRAPRNAVFEQIIKDCTEAADLLPVSHTNANKGRATKGAALALVAKTHLYLKNWSQVIQFVDQVKGLGIYDLMEDYQDNFRKNTQNNKESVWEIQHANLELGVGNSLNQWFASRKFGSGYGFAETTQEYVMQFEPGDPRRRFTVAQNNDPYFGQIYKPSFSTTRFGPVKYLQSDEEVSQKADGDINYTAIRFAEVLLWEAEAMAELGMVAQAQVPLERVRARARAQAANPAVALPPVTTTDQNAMIQAVRHERNVELGYEMHRFFDLVRWGVAADLLPGFQRGKHEVFPLPQTEMDLNPSLVQNPGY
jgi:hypothetical protein